MSRREVPSIIVVTNNLPTVFLNSVTEHIEGDGAEQSQGPDKSTDPPDQPDAPAVLGQDRPQHHQAAIQRDGRQQEATDKHVEKEHGGVEATEGCAQGPCVATGHEESEEGQGGSGQEVGGCKVEDPDADDGAADMEAHYSQDEQVLQDADTGDEAMQAHHAHAQGADLARGVGRLTAVHHPLDERAVDRGTRVCHLEGKTP